MTNIRHFLEKLAAKATPVGTDYLMLGDSADSERLKKVLISDLPSPSLVTAGPHAGPGTVLLSAGTINLYDTTGGPLTLQLPASPADGDEIHFLDASGSPGDPLTIDANGTALFEPWWVGTGGAFATFTMRIHHAKFSLRFLAAFGVWLPHHALSGLRMSVPTTFDTAGAPHTIEAFQHHRYDGSATFTFDLPAAPTESQEASVIEAVGSGAGTVTINGNGNNLVNDSGAGAASMVLSSAYAHRRWVWTGAIWAMVSKVN